MAATLSQRSELTARQERLEEEVARTVERVNGIERRMYGGEVSASRELQAMADEVASLGRRRAELEDQVVELMEAVEPVESQVAGFEAERRAMDEEQEGLVAELGAGEREIDAEAEVEARIRGQVAATLSAELVGRYERLRARLGGVGAARLEHGSCGGCHLAIPSAELDRIRRAPPDAVLTCDQCGRILVR